MDVGGAYVAVVSMMYRFVKRLGTEEPRQAAVLLFSLLQYLNLLTALVALEIAGFSLLGNPTVQLLLVLMAGLLYFANGRYVKLANIWDRAASADRHEPQASYTAARLYVLLTLLAGAGEAAAIAAT